MMKLSKYILLSLLMLTTHLNAFTFKELEQGIDYDIKTYVMPTLESLNLSERELLVKGFGSILYSKLNGIYALKNFSDYLKEQPKLTGILGGMLVGYSLCLVKMVNRACRKDMMFFFDREIFDKECIFKQKKPLITSETQSEYNKTCDLMVIAFENLCHEIFLKKLSVQKSDWVDYEIQPLPFQEDKNICDAFVDETEKGLKALIKSRYFYASERINNKDYNEDMVEDAGKEEEKKS